jgi:hypothetical protein
MEDGGKLFRECEKAAIGGRLLIAQSGDEAAGCEASAGDAGGEPGLVHLREETADLTPTGALTGLAGIAYEHDVQVQTVTGGIDHAVGSTADDVADDGQKLEEHGGRVGLGVGSDGADGESGDAMESGFGKPGRIEIADRRWSGGRRNGLLLQLVVRLLLSPVGWFMVKLDAEQLGAATLYIRKGWKRWPREACGGARYHGSTLLRFRIAVENSLVTPEKGDFVWLEIENNFMSFTEMRKLLTTQLLEGANFVACQASLAEYFLLEIACMSTNSRVSYQYADW